MRLARLAAVGLAIGVIAGFAIALLRPRPHGPSIEDHNDLSDDEDQVGLAADEQMAAEEQLWEKFRKSGSTPDVEFRAPRRVNG
jgi:hypothetical protein